MNTLEKKLKVIDKKLAGLIRQHSKAVEEAYVREKKRKKNTDFQDFIMWYKHKRLSRFSHEEEKRLMAMLYTEVDSYLLRKYARTRVSFLGPLATFTHQAAKDYFGSFVELKSEKSIADVFQEVENGKSDFGVAPVENSVEGAVSHTLDLFISSGVNIYSEVLLPIRLDLMSNSPLGKIRTVISRGIVFGQCRTWLKSNLPNAELVETSSTAEAVKMIKNKKTCAAIGSSLCSEIYHVGVIAESIQDDTDNTTRFLIISRKKNRKAKRNKTSIVYLVKDRPGALFESLKPFKVYGVNLVKIESRPSRMRAWEYYFFVDMEGFVTDKKVKTALEILKKKCVFLKILGSYPVS
ncbi:MAG: prephenate dehydratase [Candidatus Aureabacteria bacterium]|nr:prephenate dehydratase [Candidatus Auribacterota bacterium]